MGIVETFVVAVALATIATFTFITRGLKADMSRLHAAPQGPNAARHAA